MAKARKLEKRRRSIRSIRKITRTMELIARARFKRAMDRAIAGAVYTRRIAALVRRLARTGLELGHPLLQPRTEMHRPMLLVLTANRGLCGGYNSSVMRLACARRDSLLREVPEVRLEVSGKRGIAAFRFRGIQPEEQFTHFEDRPGYAEVELLANRYLEAYQRGELDQLDVVYAGFESLSRQQAVLETLLPLASIEELEEEPAAEPRYDFFPSPERILDEVVPLSFKLKLFKCFLDMAVSEQIARMMAMKAATENADAMISNLTITYNRARQGQITSELLEVISGAEALSK